MDQWLVLWTSDEVVLVQVLAGFSLLILIYRQKFINYTNTYRLLSATISLFQKFCGGGNFLFTLLYLLSELL